MAAGAAPTRRAAMPMAWPAENTALPDVIARAVRPETMTSRPSRSIVATSCAVWTLMSSIF